MSWDNIQIENTGKFLKIEGGSFVDIHILDEHPKKELVHGGGKDRVDCMGEGCNLCDDPDTSDEMRRQERFKTNVLDRKDGKVKIWEFGGGVAGQVRGIAQMLAESEETVHSVDFRITATGSQKSKRYTVIQKKMISPVPEGLKLHKL